MTKGSRKPLQIALVGINVSAETKTYPKYYLCVNVVLGLKLKSAVS